MTNRPAESPKRDMAGEGQRLSSEWSIQIVTCLATPPHTLYFRGKDNGQTARVRTGEEQHPFKGTAALDQYLASSQKFAKAAAAYGATVLLSNHTEFDNGYYKAHTAAFRKPGEPNPFDVGQNGVARYFTVVQNCTMAAKLRAAKM